MYELVAVVVEKNQNVHRLVVDVDVVSSVDGIYLLRRRRRHFHLDNHPIDLL